MAEGSSPPFLLTLYRQGVLRVFPSIFLGTMSACIVLPYLPTLATNYFASIANGAPIDCESFARRSEPRACREAHSTAVLWSTGSSFVSNILLTFFLAPAVGRWSDKYGRKPFLLLGAVISALPLWAVLGYVSGLLPFQIYYPASSLASGAISTISLAIALCTDLLPGDLASLRGPAFGLVLSGFSVGLIIGPLIGSMVGGVVPAATTAVFVQLLCLAYGFIFLPNQQEQQRLAAQYKALSAGSMEGPGEAGALGGRLPQVVRLLTINRPSLKVHEVNDGELRSLLLDVDEPDPRAAASRVQLSDAAVTDGQQGASSGAAGPAGGATWPAAPDSARRGRSLDIHRRRGASDQYGHVSVGVEAGGGGAVSPGPGRLRASSTTEFDRPLRPAHPHRPRLPSAVPADAEPDIAPGKIIGGLMGSFRVAFRSKLFRRLTICAMFSATALEGAQDLLLQYLQLEVGFTSKDQGVLFAIFGASGLFAQLFLLRPLTYLLGDATVLVLGNTAIAMQMLLLAFFTHTKFMAYVGIVVVSFGTLASPAISAIKSRNASEDEQGEVQGALAGSRSIASGFGPLVFALIFTWFTTGEEAYFPGAPFAFGLALMIVSVYMALQVRRIIHAAAPH